MKSEYNKYKKNVREKKFDESLIKVFNSAEVEIDKKNKVIVKRIEFKGKKFLTFEKYYKQVNENQENSEWKRGKTIWLNDNFKNGYEVLNKAISLYDEKRKDKKNGVR